MMEYNDLLIGDEMNRSKSKKISLDLPQFLVDAFDLYGQNEIPQLNRTQVIEKILLTHQDYGKLLMSLCEFYNNKDLEREEKDKKRILDFLNSLKELRIGK